MNLQGMFNSAYHENMNVILSMVEHNSNARVLDLGCGDGVFTSELAANIGTTDIHGIDVFKEEAEASRRKGIQVHSANLNEKFPIKDKLIDVVCANQIIEHLHETDLFIHEIRRVLRPGGYAIVSTPNLASLHSMTALVLGKQPHSAEISNEVRIGTLFNTPQQRSKPDAHLRIFTYEGLGSLFEYHGFRIERMLGVGYYPFPIRIAKLISHLDKRHSVYLTIKARK